MQHYQFNGLGFDSDATYSSLTACTELKKSLRNSLGRATLTVYLQTTNRINGYSKKILRNLYPSDHRWWMGSFNCLYVLFCCIVLFCFVSFTCPLYAFFCFVVMCLVLFCLLVLSMLYFVLL